MIPEMSILVNVADRSVKAVAKAVVCYPLSVDMLVAAEADAAAVHTLASTRHSSWTDTPTQMAEALGWHHRTALVKNVHES